MVLYFSLSCCIVIVFFQSYEGYVMDYKCIELGTLVDNPTLVSLQNPDVHSVHWYVVVS
jgi:hypothetical protein